MKSALAIVLFMAFSSGCVVTDDRPPRVIVKEGVFEGIGSYVVGEGGKMANQREYDRRYNLTMNSKNNVSESEAHDAISTIASDICRGSKFDTEGGVAPEFVNQSQIIGDRYSSNHVRSGSVILATFGCYE